MWEQKEKIEKKKRKMIREVDIAWMIRDTTCDYYLILFFLSTTKYEGLSSFNYKKIYSWGSLLDDTVA